MSATGASFARGDSKQDYATPREFLDAVERRWGKLTYDLAADEDNHVTPKWFGPGRDRDQQDPRVDSFAADWPTTGRLWLNPPFNDIAPWARKCAEHRAHCDRAHTAEPLVFLLVPASIGSNWFADFVFPYARVFALQGRLSFDGKHPYPKDCILAVYGLIPAIGFEVWDWRKR